MLKCYAATSVLRASPLNWALCVFNQSCKGIGLNKNEIESITQVVFPKHQDEFQHAEVLVVLGSYKATQYKMPTAVQLYKEKKVSKLLLSGGNLAIDRKPEFESMREYALTNGVSESDIILEPHAKNTVENAQFSAEIIVESEVAKKSVAILTTAFHIKRAKHLFKNVLPQSLELYGYFVNDRSTRRDNWWLTESAVSRVMHSHEVIKSLGVKPYA
ncbi:YdcF family protein [Vibrio alginolyticus]|uniref:YdcF family protein n=3 Tax=Vibrio harveyi group TaxID=717610 RepID=UPI00215C0993|nr:YdcF family protein [Vibrio alginolyticus]MCR9412966.1 YdcF family protein [Vibrio alginolyticus]